MTQRYCPVRRAPALDGTPISAKRELILTSQCGDRAGEYHRRPVGVVLLLDPKPVGLVVAASAGPGGLSRG